MKNFLFISPNFPNNYWRFCRALQQNGFRVLGVGDCPYQDLQPELRDCLTEYFVVKNLADYDEVYRAVAYFIYRYGRIDWLESNNEFWLEQDAKLRTDFHITSGFCAADMPKVKYKSKMKEFYRQAGVKTARYCIAENEHTCKRFIAKVGYPVIVKPDNGVGANGTWKLSCDEDLYAFLRNKPQIDYIMEEFIHAEINSYDAIIDSQGNPIFETGNVTPISLMDVVNNVDDSVFYMLKEPFEDVREAGRRTVKAFGVKNRFVHFEFFRLLSDQSIGKKGEVVALEVNMRPSGGVSPDMMNYANSTDVYKIWADMIAYDGTLLGAGEQFYCAFAGRRNGKTYAHSEEEIRQTYGHCLKSVEDVAKALSGAMGDRMIIAVFPTMEQMQEFYRFVLA